MADFEKLGAFYLGRSYDTEKGRVTDQDLVYDAKDLTTHAVCVGMTGSGKTGLCVSLLEEAALDGIPAIAIDPKGDLGNLLLTFPELRPEDFLPWIDPAEAGREGRTIAEHARATAELWRKGLGQWGQDGERIARLRQAADLAIYTPGGNAGLPLAVLRSFAAPSAEVAADPDARRERILGLVAGVLSLVGVEADPVRSREHILLSALLDRAWSAGRNLDLAALIHEIQSPPFAKLGVLDLESFFPAKERFGLAMSLNNLLASPTFAAWSEGEPLDIGRLLYCDDGRPRLSILSIAHLSEAERMFFVTILLNEVVAWMRAQPGTSSLRALLYMDEVFGYFPPTANPPSKTPMLTLLKQARAYGLGVVLATQNPVDLDYKGLSNAGTWFLGRLQTERDKARVIEGLEGASAATGGAFDRARTEQILAGLGSRVFLMNNVHEDAPVVFHTRWAMSYLRGPLTRGQIATLMADRKAALAPVARAESAPPRASQRPVVPPKVEEHFAAAVGEVDLGGRLIYRPALLGVATLHYVRAAQNVDVWENVALLVPLSGDSVPANPWAEATLLTAGPPDLEDEPADGAGFASLPSKASQPASYVSWSKRLKSHLYQARPLEIWRCNKPKGYSRPGEREGEFRAQLRQTLHEQRDRELEKLRKRFAPKLARLQDRIQRAEQTVEVQRSQYKQQKLQVAVSLGATVLGALFGRKIGSIGNVGRASSTVRGAGRASRERGDVGRAQQNVATLESDLVALEADFQERLVKVRDEAEEAELECQAVLIRPRKADLTIEQVALVWLLWQVDADGIAEPLYETPAG